MSVRCLNKQLPYIQEMIKAVGSEVLTSKALAEFADEYNPTIPEVLDMVSRIRTPISETELDKRFTKLMAEHGITIERSHLGGNVRGQVDFMHKLIKLNEGQDMGDTFIEEGSHVLVELIRQNNPTLYQSMYSDINKYPIYQEVVKQYGNVYKDIINNDDYISRERQLRDEAMGKLIAQIYKNKINASEPQTLRIKNWFSRVREWFKNLLPITSEQFSDVFNLTVDKFISGGFMKLRPFATSDVSMYSLDPTKGFDWENVKARIEDTKKRMTKKQDKDEQGNNKEYYFYDGRKVKNRVTETVKSVDDSKFTDDELKQNDMKAALGTDLHADMENITIRYVEKQNGVRPDKMTPKTEGVSGQVYSALERFMHDLLDADLFNGAEIYTEVKLYDPIKDMGGTVDLLVLDKNGKAHIFDWKFVTANGRTGKKGKNNLVSFSKKKQWKAQLALYRDILQKQYGVKTFGQTRMIPFGVEYEEGAKFKSIEVDSNTYLDNVVPSDEETTGNTNLDKLIQQLKNQYKELKEKSKYTDEAAQIRLKSLQRAIDELRTKQDMTKFIMNAGYDIKRLRETLAQEEVTDSDIKDIISKLDFYRNLTFVLNLDTSGKLSDIIKNAVQLEAEFYGDATKSGKLAVWKATNKVNYDKMQTIGAMYSFSTLQQINNPVFQLLSRKTTEALNHKELRMRQLKDKFMELKGKLTGGYERLLAKDEKGNYIGTLIQRYNKKFYDELSSADTKWLYSNVKVRDTIIIDGKEVNAKEHFEQQLEETSAYYRASSPQDADKLIDKYRKKWDVWSEGYKEHAFKQFQERRNHRYLQPSDNWYSSEYKWLKDNPDSAESQLYDIFQKIILDARDVADTGINSNYIPSRKKNVLNRALALDGEGIKDAMIEGLTMEDYIINMDNDKSLKLVLSKELGAEKDLDLMSVYLGFADKVYHSKYMKDVEDVAYIGKAVLQNGKYIKTNKFGNPVRSNGIVETVDVHDAEQTVQRTLKAYDEFTDAIIYSTDDGKDIKLGTIDGKAISGKKTLSALLEYNAITALGGNVLSGTANIIGAMFNQAFLRLGDSYFNKGTFKDAYSEIASSIFNSDSKAMQVMTLFDINSTSNVSKWQKKVAIDPSNKVSKDIAFFIQQGGDHVTQNAGLIAFLKSSTINERGRVVKKTEPSEESIYDKFVINGNNVENLLTDEQVNYIRNKVREINTEVTGSLSDRDKLLIKQTTFGRMFTQFKTFAIPMGKARVGQLYYNANMDEYKEGRFRVATAMVFNDMFKPRENLKYLMSFNISAIKGNMMQGLKDRYQELIDLNPNFDPDLNPETGLSFEQYLEMTKKSIKTAVTELAVAGSTMALMVLASAYDDDEDEASNTQRFLAENLFRISRELTFWFNPDSLIDFVSDTPAPVLGLVSRTGGFVHDLFQEGFGLVYGDDGILETAKPVKKGISIMPFGKLINQVISLIDKQE